jgi:hypothetical protein
VRASVSHRVMSAARAYTSRMPEIASATATTT